MDMVTSGWRCVVSAEVLKVLLDIQHVDHESAEDLNACIADT